MEIFYNSRNRFYTELSGISNKAEKTRVMPELRKDPVIGRWVIISTERGKRPSDFDEVEVEQNIEFCRGSASC